MERPALTTSSVERSHQGMKGRDHNERPLARSDSFSAIDTARSRFRLAFMRSSRPGSRQACAHHSLRAQLPCRYPHR
jgi:hypothetical protein